MLDIQEISIILAANNLTPALLSLDFLRGSGIVPEDWELSQTPTFTNRASQVVFQNGVSLTAQPGTIMFSESFSGEIPEEFRVSEVVRAYVTTLPNVDYRAVAINPRRFVTLEESSEDAGQYIARHLLTPGAWQDLGDAPVQASINLNYTLEDRAFRLNISEANLQSPDQDPTQALVFAGSFAYELTEETRDGRIKTLNKVLQNLFKDFKDYREVINTKFLKGLAIKPE
ncbi:MAG: hypothetical protein ACKO5P_02585 [Nodosilinea sp.]